MIIVVFAGDEKEPMLEEIKAAMDAFDFTDYEELVYCGYGEPTCALDNLLASAADANTPLSIVDVLSKEEIEACQKLADDRGIYLKIRKFS